MTKLFAEMYTVFGRFPQSYYTTMSILPVVIPYEAATAVVRKLLTLHMNTVQCLLLFLDIRFGRTVKQ